MNRNARHFRLAMPPAASVLLASAALALAACDEIRQDAAKPFAGPEETRSHAGALAERAAMQDEYRVTGDAKTDEKPAAPRAALRAGM